MFNLNFGRLVQFVQSINHSFKGQADDVLPDHFGSMGQADGPVLPASLRLLNR